MFNKIKYLCCGSLIVLAQLAHAQPAGGGNYPERPIRMIAAQSAGSSLDTLLRIFAQKMTEVMGQQIVVDNRGGAGGTIGVELAARSPTDGYTLLAGASSSMIVSSFTYKKLPFDTLRKRRFNQFLRNVEAQCAFFVHGMRNRPIFSLVTSIF